MVDLSKFTQDDKAEGEKDTLGGFLRDSDATKFKIDVAYLSQSSGGAMSLTLHAVDDNNKEYRETIYFTNKQGQTYWERDGKRNNLPGFNLIQAICLLAGRKPLSEMTSEDKDIKVYDFEQQREVVKTMPTLKELTNADVVLGILRVIEDKKKKNEATGVYEPTGETRELNKIDKVFRAGCNRTVTEIQAGEETGSFIDKWLDKHKGQVLNTAKGKKGNDGNVGTGMPTGSGDSGSESNSGGSLFS